MLKLVKVGLMLFVQHLFNDIHVL